jgi:hypothetical protein
MITREEYAKVHAVLFETYGRKTTEEQLEIWFRVLEDLAFESLERAVIRWISECESAFPTPAALRRFAVESEEGRLLDVDEAWLVFWDVHSKVSPYYEAQRFLNLLPPMIRQTVQALGGPGSISEWPIENRTAQHAQFRDVYRSILARAETQRRLPETLRPRLAASNAAVKRIAYAFGIPHRRCPLAIGEEITARGTRGGAHGG